MLSSKQAPTAAPAQPPDTVRTAGCCEQEKRRFRRHPFILLRRLRLFPLPKAARKRFPSAFAISATLPHVGATSVFPVSGGYAPGCVRKIGHSRDTRLTRADRRFPAAPVGTLLCAFGCVPARILRPVSQVSAHKTAGWKTGWAGACTEGFRSACVRPV